MIELIIAIVALLAIGVGLSVATHWGFGVAAVGGAAFIIVVLERLTAGQPK